MPAVTNSRQGAPGPRISHQHLWLVIAVGTLLLAAPARADDKVAARDHWERGTKFYDLGKYDDAIREFEAAYEAKGDPAFLYNLAQSHRLAGHTNDALRFYRTYLRYVPKAANRADIEDRIKELEKTVAQRGGGEAAVTPPVLGTTGPQGGPALPPGAASATQNPPAEGPAGAGQPGGPGAAPIPGAAIEPQAGASGLPGAPPPGGAPSEPAPVVKRSPRKTAGIVIAAAGGGVFVLGGVFGLVAQSKSKAVETAATSGQRFDPSVERAGKTFEKLQWVGYGLGTAAIIAGVVIYVTAPPQFETASPPRVTVAPFALPGSGGALVRLTF